MVVARKNILSIVRYGDLDKWSVDTLNINSLFTSKKTQKLSKIIRRVKEPILIDDATEYQRITVKLYGNGVVERDKAYGKDIGTKRQFKATSGQLIISRIDARNGAFGVVPEELNGAIVTNDFWLFDVHGADVKFLMLVLSSFTFQKYWQSKSNGTTNRQRVGEEDFLNCKIPFPNINEQSKLVLKYESALDETKACEIQAERLEANIESYLFKMLEITEQYTDKEEQGFIKRYNLSQLSRWDAWTMNNQYFSRRYNYVNFESVVVGSPFYGANEKAVKTPTKVRYVRITDINEDGTLSDEFVSATKVEEKYLLKENDFLIARSGNTVGKTFLYKNSFGECIFAGYLIKFILNTKKVVPEYLFYYSKSQLFKSWIKSNQRIFGQPNINGQEYLKAQIIVPTIELQQEIVNHISVIREQIQALLQKADSLRSLAKVEFEDAVFSE